MIIFSGCDVSKTNISKIENAETTTSKNEDEILTEKPEPEKETIELLQKEELDIPVNSIQKHGKTLMLYGDVKENNELKSLEAIMQQYNKRFSVVIWSLDGTSALSYNTDATFFSACTIKAGFAMYCCKQIDAGIVSKDELMTYEAKHYHGGSGRIRYSKYGTQYTIQYLIEQSLNISDNVAYEMLLDRFGTEGYDQFMKEIGAETLILNGRMWGSKITAHDLIKVWNEMYNYFKTKTVASEFLQKCCTGSPYNYGTQMLKDCTYSHKSGDNFGASAAYNDAGIVWTKNDGYVYAILSNSEGEYIDKKLFSSVMTKVNDVFGGSVV